VGGANLPFSAYGEKGRSRDINRVLVAEIINQFVEAYYTPDAVRALDARRTART